MYPMVRLSLLSAVATVAVVAIGGCAARSEGPDPVMTVAAEAGEGCARPAVLVRNLTNSAVILDKSQGGQRSFVAEVPAGGAYQHRAEPATGYYLRSARGHGTAADYARPVTGMDRMARVERICTD